MFSEYITLGQAIIVTLFSMGIVFISLLAISYLMDLLRVSLSKKDKKADNIKTIQQAPQSSTVAEDDTELVAVITAAIAAMTGSSASGLVVRNIKRLPDSDTVWSKTGKIELMR